MHTNTARTSTAHISTAHSTRADSRRGLGFRLFTATVCAGAFAGLSGLVAPVANAEHPIGGRIELEYHEAAAANGQPPEEFFGPSTTPELDAARGGRWQNFAGDQAIYWHPLVSDGYANQIGGEIRSKWGETTGPDGGWEHGPLAYPTTREWPSHESGASGEVARGNHFEGGTVYAVPDSGAYVTWGLIRTAWWALGAEQSDLGLPAGDERATDNGWIQDFEGGSVQVFHDGMVAVAMHDPDASALDTNGPVTLQELG